MTMAVTLQLRPQRPRQDSVMIAWAISLAANVAASETIRSRDS